jgi:Mg2+ and Co2+ transporter CorA
MAKKTTLHELGEMIRHLVKASADFATKDDLKDLATKDHVRAIVREEIGELVPGIVALELKPMREQLNDIEKRLDTLDDNYKNLKGVTKEIDEIRAEVRAIQKHLGIEKKIAA